jgi:putative tryptophan/tyrosine transport system substrate-binding protein
VDQRQKVGAGHIMMRRREFIGIAGGAVVAWPLAASAQQKAMPVIGFVGGFAPSMQAIIELEQAAFRQGLGETGYVEGQNVAIVYGRGEGDLDRLPALAADLVARKVDVIVTQGSDAASLAAKNATSTIPILFHTFSDPVALGLVASLARPGGNLTGVSMMRTELMPKLLELLLELVPQARVIALLVLPDEASTERIIGYMQGAARATRVDLRVLKARTESEIDAAFATLIESQADALILGLVAFRPKIAALALRHGVPAIAPFRDFAVSGGLLSYGASNTDPYRLKGVYAGKILNGAKPADLPVQQSTKFELVINLTTAKALGLTVPQSILARADEVIE